MQRIKCTVRDLFAIFSRLFVWCGLMLSYDATIRSFAARMLHGLFSVCRSSCHYVLCTVQVFMHVCCRMSFFIILLLLRSMRKVIEPIRFKANVKGMVDIWLRVHWLCCRHRHRCRCRCRRQSGPIVVLNIWWDWLGMMPVNVVRSVLYIVRITVESNRQLKRFRVRFGRHIKTSFAVGGWALRCIHSIRIIIKLYDTINVQYCKAKQANNYSADQISRWSVQIIIHRAEINPVPTMGFTWIVHLIWFHIWRWVFSFLSICLWTSLILHLYDLFADWSVFSRQNHVHINEWLGRQLYYEAIITSTHINTPHDTIKARGTRHANCVCLCVGVRFMCVLIFLLNRRCVADSGTHAKSETRVACGLLLSAP